MIGLGASAVNGVRKTTVLLSLKWGWLNHWGFIPFFVVTQLVVFSFVNNWGEVRLQNFIPLIASIFFIVALYFSNLIYTKIFFIIVGCLWLYYEFVTGVYGHMIGESFTLISNIVALVVLLRLKGKGSKKFLT